MNRFLIFLAALFLMLALNACKKTVDPYQLPEDGFEYFPLEIGKYLIYEVDSVIFDPQTGGTLKRESKTFVKEELIDTLRDNEDNLVYKIERFERNSDTLPWEIAQVMTASLNEEERQAFRTEDNFRFLKMVFPAQNFNNWNGNVHFDERATVQVEGETLQMFKAWNYRMENVGEPDSLGLFNFDETMQICQADNENAIELRIANEKYAKDIGLYYRELWILDTQCIEDCTGQSWEEKAEKGFILRQQLIEHN